MKIIRLHAENVKRLEAVEIRPDGNLIVIGGANGAGKSSVLDSIMYALKGKASQPTRPVREGQKKAEITCELDDLTIRRVIDESGASKLVVSAKDGGIYPSPQAMLDKLTGALAFDPLEFTRQKPAAQRETLKLLLGLDFSELDRKKQETFDARTENNREHKAIEAQLAGMPPHKKAPEVEVSVAALMEELDRRQVANKKREDLARDIKESTALAAKYEMQIDETLKALRGVREETVRRKKIFAEMPWKNTDEVTTKIAEAEGVNRTIRQNRERAELEARWKRMDGIVGARTKALQKIDEQKAAQLKAAKPPVPGLSFDDTGVLYNGLPFDQSSSAEQLRVSTAMGLAMSPELPVMLLRDGSLLDPANLKMIAEMAAENDAQVWLERVGEGKECQVVIEDGMVKGAVNDQPS